MTVDSLEPEREWRFARLKDVLRAIGMYVDEPLGVDDTNLNRLDELATEARQHIEELLH